MAVASRAASRAVWTPANVVTMGRIVLSPIVVAVIYFYAPAWWVLIFGFLAMITDRLDGWLARRYGSSELGAFLDPLADKLMVLGSLAVIVARGWVWWLPAVLIALREVLMSSWRSKLARHGVSVPARKLAKLKTWSQSVTVALAITPTIVDAHHWALNWMLWCSVTLTLITFAQYVHDGRYSLRAQAPR